MEDKEGALNCKVALIGESGVNKRGIIIRYITNEFYDILPSTPGANFTTKTFFLKKKINQLNLKFGILQVKKNIVH